MICPACNGQRYTYEQTFSGDRKMDLMHPGCMPVKCQQCEGAGQIVDQNSIAELRSEIWRLESLISDSKRKLQPLKWRLADLSKSKGIST